MRRLGNQIRHWQRDQHLDPEEAAAKLGMTLDRFLDVSTLGRPAPEEIERIAGITGIDRGWLEGWANRPQRTVTVVGPRM